MALRNRTNPQSLKLRDTESHQVYYFGKTHQDKKREIKPSDKSVSLDHYCSVQRADISECITVRHDE